MGSQPPKWFSCPSRNLRSTLDLICIPYAGGSSMSYLRFTSELPAHLQVWLAQLPGRAPRFTEPPVPSIPLLVSALADAWPVPPTRPYALFGHSMGAIIAFELAREIRRR